MERIRIAHTYDAKWLEIERPQPLVDNHIESLISKVIKGGVFTDITDQVYTDFKTEMHTWLSMSTLNNFYGLEHFQRRDIINGCTQYIDNIYIDGPAQTIEGDYRYHQRLNKPYSNIGSLAPNVPLIIALPFPRVGQVHEQMETILNECVEKNIPVHIDGAWITCCRDVQFDFNHTAIHSVGISLSKGLGLGWNRIGIRYSRNDTPNSVTIMNDFHMNNRALSMIGLYFLRNLPPDYLWNKYSNSYYKICTDFNLTPTKSIHLALRDGQPVGLSPLLRFLNE